MRRRGQKGEEGGGRGGEEGEKERGKAEEVGDQITTHLIITSCSQQVPTHTLPTTTNSREDTTYNGAQQWTLNCTTPSLLMRQYTGC